MAKVNPNDNVAAKPIVKKNPNSPTLRSKQLAKKSYSEAIPMWTIIPSCALSQTS